MKEPTIPNCHADSDGDCDWDKCPQARDNEPKATGRYCPNAAAWEAYYMDEYGDPWGCS